MKFFIFWKPFVIALIILYGSITSNNNIEALHILNFKYSDKIIHFIFYFLLSLTFISSLNKGKTFNLFNQKIITLILGISYGLLMEVFQFYLTASRSAEVSDIVANSAGCILGVVLFSYILKFSFSKYL